MGDESRAGLMGRVPPLLFAEGGMVSEEFLDKLGPIWGGPVWRRASEPGHRKDSEGAEECQTEEKAVVKSQVPRPRLARWGLRGRSRTSGPAGQRQRGTACGNCQTAVAEI